MIKSEPYYEENENIQYNPSEKIRIVHHIRDALPKFISHL